MSNITNNRALMSMDDYMSENAYYLEDDDDFLDVCLNKFGKMLKSVGNKGVEFIKRKWMIGKYSRNLKSKLRVYLKMKPIYVQINKLSSIIESGNYDKIIYNRYVKDCNKLNLMCYKFKDVLPELNYLNPLDAPYNYEIISDYMKSFSGRNGIVIK